MRSSQGNLVTWIKDAVQPSTDTIWVETGKNHSRQWAELRVVWLVHEWEPLALTLRTNNWVVLKRLTQCLGQWKAMGVDDHEQALMRSRCAWRHCDLPAKA